MVCVDCTLLARSLAKLDWVARTELLGFAFFACVAWFAKTALVALAQLASLARLGRLHARLLACFASLF